MNISHALDNSAIYYDAGQVATIILETVDNNGIHINPKSPTITMVLDPNMKQMKGFPAPMTKLGEETGIFVARFKLPNDPGCSGTYICLVNWQDEAGLNKKIYSIIIGAVPITISGRGL